MTLVHESELLEFRSLVARHLGLWFDDHRREFLAGVLQDRTGVRRCSDAASYLRHLGIGSWPDEWAALAGATTVTETYFLRGPEHFRALMETALVECRQRSRGNRPLRLLSAGCASGEEPYSMAIALREQAPWSDQMTVEIVGVDANRDMLARARRARFSAWSLRETPPAVRARYFQPVGGDFVLEDKIRTIVSFVERNLAASNDDLWQPGTLDVVFCRNMLMYFTPEAAEALVNRIQRALAPGGFLFLGHAETLRGLSEAFRLRRSHGAFFYQVDEPGEGRPDYVGAATSENAETSWSAPIAPCAVGASWVDEIGRSTEKIELLSASTARAQSSAPAAARVASDPVRGGFDQALDLHRQERFTEALAHLQGVPAPGRSQNADWRILEAVLLVNCGRTEEAEAICRPLLSRLNAGAHYIVGLCREHAGDLATAINQAETAAYLDAQFAMPRFHLGLLCKRRGDERRALGHFEEALALLMKEDPTRLLLFGGGFSRETLVQACRAEIRRLGGGA